MTGEWTLFSNHGHVLVCLARNKRARLRDVAQDVGITERAVQKIVSELQQAGIIAISKHGRCNHYEINSKKSLRHPLESQCTVGRLMQLIVKSPAEGEPEPATRRAAEKRTPTRKPAPQRAQPEAAPPAQPEARPPAQPEAETTTSKKAATEKRAKPKDPKDDDSRKQGSLF